MVPQRLPAWLKTEIPIGRNPHLVPTIVSKYHLNTVCRSAKCPNINGCFSRKMVTFLILGDICTRRCKFCAVNKGKPLSPSPDEPERVAMATLELNLDYVTITSVTRDDLDDGGTSHFRRVIQCVREKVPQVQIEVLVPDFQGSLAAVGEVIGAEPSIFGHNLETVPRLYPKVRPGASYARSLKILKQAKELSPHMLTKSGLMLGLGETTEEILETLTDLSMHGCDIVTLGQYLAPSEQHLPVVRFVPPEEFEWLKMKAEAMGFKQVLAAPLIRSSYQPA